MNWMKTCTLSIIIILSSAMIFSPSITRGEQIIKSRQIDSVSLTDYNKSYYVDFINIFSNNISLQSSKRIFNLTTDETAEITLTITSSMSEKYSDFDFTLDFVIVKEDWVPRYIREGVSYGENERLLEEEVRFYSNWYKDLHKKTDNVIDLEHDESNYSFEEKKKEIDISFNIRQKGQWKMYILIKPKLGEYYINFNSELDISVDKSDDLYTHLPIIFSISISAVVVFLTVCIRTRFSFLKSTETRRK